MSQAVPPPACAVMAHARSEDAAAGVVELTVSTISGETAAVLSVPLSSSVFDVKARIAETEGTPVWKQQLLHETDLLRDSEPLSVCGRGGLAGPQARLTLVRTAVARQTATPASVQCRPSAFEDSPMLSYIFMEGDQGQG